MKRTLRQEIEGDRREIGCPISRFFCEKWDRPISTTPDLYEKGRTPQPLSSRAKSRDLVLARIVTGPNKDRAANETRL
jgi:hypothetical protein